MTPGIKRLIGLHEPRKTLRTLAIILTVFAGANVAFPRYIVATGSMEPTISVGDYVMTSRIPLWFSEPSAGDIVVFRPEEGISPAPWIHRLVGEPGMRIRDLSETRRARNRRDVLPAADRSSFVAGPDIPAGYYYQAGDSPASYHGLVPREKVIARVLFHFPLPWKSRPQPQTKAELPSSRPSPGKNH